MAERVLQLPGGRIKFAAPAEGVQDCLSMKHRHLMSNQAGNVPNMIFFGKTIEPKFQAF